MTLYTYCNKPSCRTRGERDMGYFINSQGDPNKIILGAQAVYGALNCGFTDEEVVYYCRVQGKQFGTAARDILNCSSGSPWSCRPSTYMPRASVSLRTNKNSILNNGTDSANLSWVINGHYNSITLSNVGSVQCNGNSSVRPTTTTTYTLTVCNNGGCRSSRQTITVIEPVPTINYLTITPSTIIQGNSSNLQWSVSGTISYVTINTIGVVSSVGSISGSPPDDVTYTLTAYGPGGSVSRNVTLVVYIPPTVVLSLDKNTINRGESTNLRWTTLGDANRITLSPGIGDTTNLSSFMAVSPTETTTYTAYASGLGGSGSDEITLTVYRPPSLTLSGPIKIFYGSEFNLSYAVESTASIAAVVRYEFLDGSYMEDNIFPSINQTILPFNDIPWGIFGPYSISVSMTAYGEGNLTDNKTITIPVEIDETPDVIDIPQSEDKVRNEEPVVSPEVEVTTEQILVSDIDIPVEVTADNPIQIEIDNNGTWINVRQS